jgi:hypothetical protein
MLIAVAAGLWAPAAMGQTTLIDLRTQGKSVDFSQSSSTKPIKTGAVVPATCSSGELFLDLSAPAGSNLRVCVSANTWAQISGGGLPALGSAHQLLGVKTAGDGLEYKGLGVGLYGSGGVVQVDDAVIPVYVAGTGVPAMACTPGRMLYTDTAGGGLYYCRGIDTWAAVAGPMAYVQGQPSGGDTVTAAGKFASHYAAAAGTLQAGTVLEIMAAGTITLGTSSRTPRFAVRLCSDTACTNAPLTVMSTAGAAVAAGAADYGWSVRGTITVTAAGQMEASGVSYLRTSASESVVETMTNATPLAFNAAVPLYLAIEETETLGSGDAVTMRQYTVRASR